MAVYEFKALDQKGITVSGQIEAGSHHEASMYVHDDLGYTPLKIKEKKESFLKKISEQFQKVPLMEVLNFTKQLYTLEKAGVPILSSLTALKEQAETKLFKEILVSIHRDVEGGSSLSEAFSKYPSVFPDSYTHSVMAGEAAGALDTVLSKLNFQMARQDEITRSVKKAMRYPIMTLSAIVMAFVVVIIFVLPNFIGMFTNVGGVEALPLPTRILLGISDVIQSSWYIIIGSFIGIAFGWNKYIHTDQGHYNWDVFKLRLPVFGKLFHMVSIARFSSTLQTLNKSGLPIIQALDIGGKASGNLAIQKAADEIVNQVQKGKGLTEPFQKSKMFPPLVIQMISVGEESGSLDEMLQNVSEHYDSMVNEAITGLTAVIEPIMTVIIGGLVALLATGIFLPMWGMIEAFGPQ